MQTIPEDTQSKPQTASHTPGPWQAIQRYSDELSVVDQGGFEIVEANTYAILLGYQQKLNVDHHANHPGASREIPSDEQMANARLIAAAPELLHVCQKMLIEVRAYKGWCDMLKAAIAKATCPTGR